MQKIPHSFIAAAVVALGLGGAILGYDNQPISEEIGYKRNNPTAAEADIQKTILRPDGTKFNISGNFVKINENNKVIESSFNEKCTELKCDRESVEISLECQNQFDCEDENLRKAELCDSLNTQNVELFAEAMNAAKENNLDISDNPY